MTINFGYVPASSTLYIPFCTYNSSGASVTMTNFAVTDIEVYKNGSVTQRSSDNGYALLDTDGTDFDGVTGLHGFSIDLSDNTDAGFYSAGAQYWVVVSTVTVDSQTVTFIAATFRIGPIEANTTQFGSTAGTFSGGRPEVNTSHIAGSAVSTSTAQIGVNVVQISGDSASADNLESYTDGTTPMPVNVTQISGDATAADNLESYTDGTTPQPVDVTHFGGSAGTFSSGRPEAIAHSLGATAKSDVNAEVLDVLNVDTFAQPGQATPAATTTIRLMLAYLYKAFRNKSDTTDSQYSLYNDDASTVDQKATVSDDGTTLTRGEIETGP